MAEFEFSNLTGRGNGPFVRVASKLSRGVRQVNAQTVPYAVAWQEHNRRALQGDEPLWVALGDSMTQGIGAKHFKGGWVGQLDEQLQADGKHYRIINLSQSGGFIRDVLDKQLPAMESLGVTPDLVTVMIGSNDLVRKKYRVNALHDFDELLEKLPAGAVVANLLGNRGVPVAMDQRLQRAVQQKRIVLADLRRGGPKTWLGMTAADHFHPNERGYAAIARVFVAAIH